MFKIGNIEIKNNIILAPMAGTSNAAYFKICEDFNCGYFVTELISSEAIVRNNKKTFDMLVGLNELSTPWGIQIFGSDPIVMGKAAKILEEKFHPYFIDINMGCPVPKVTSTGAGSALMKDTLKVYNIVSSVVNSVSIPITVKIRSGWDNNSINAVEVAKAIEKAKASLICVHARTKTQGYSGSANLDIIKSVKESVSIPVIGNGDVKNLSDAENMISQTGCDGVMIGRASLGNPWVFNGKIPTSRDKINMIKKHYLLLKKYYGEKRALLEIRTHALYYLKGISGCKEIKNKIVQSKTEEELFKILRLI